ncbi:ABC transporter permease [Desulfopila inferna]|uniref:ABC transporter permease n=1 Tax=Desulfopila inferna TaxID=468528 RepID=UPI001966AC70|nr:ABC transporter permease subunit [Desulfopila inferna]MBM9606529.1 ABC transporter permease subunit [Desulfopila inferna]
MRRSFILLSLLPLLIPFLAVIGGGLLVTGLQSFGLMMYSYTYEDMFFAYKELFGDTWFLQSALFSLYVALTATLISIIIGTLFSYLLWRLPGRYHSWTVVYKIPLILPHIAVGFIGIILLSKTGIMASIAYQLGLIDSFEAFPNLLYTRSGFALIAAYIYKETPFVMVMVYAILSRFDRRIMETAGMLGASQLRIFFTLILPFIMPVINTTFIILFVFSFGGFDLPFVLGDSYPGMISIRIYDYFFQKDLTMRPVAMAMLTLVFCFSLIFILSYLKFSSRLEKGVRKL